MLRRANHSIEPVSFPRCVNKPHTFLLSLSAMPCYCIFPDSVFLRPPVLLATYPGAQTMSTALFARYQASQGYLGIPREVGAMKLNISGRQGRWECGMDSGSACLSHLADAARARRASLLVIHGRGRNGASSDRGRGSSSRSSASQITCSNAVRIST